MATVYNYVYGVYLNFAYSGEGGGGTDPTNVGVQTGDFVLATLITIFAIALILAAGVFFARKLKPEIFANATSKFGTMAKTASARKVLVAAIFALSVMCLIAYSITARAFANPGDEVTVPAPPPYSHATAIIDKESGNASIDDIHITDPYCKENNLHAPIVGLRINTINGFDAEKLGTWNVSVDGFDIYSGPASCQVSYAYPAQKSGELDLCISAEGISPDVYEKLNGNLGVVVELLVDKSQFLHDEDIPEKSEVSVGLIENSFDNTNKIEIAKPEEFKSYIESKGWEYDSNENLYKNEFPTYTFHSEIIEPWNYALEVGMLKNSSTLEFYQWQSQYNDEGNFIFREEKFLPVWYPEEQLVDIEYSLDQNCSLTPYGEKVLAEHNWKFHSIIEPGGSNVYIEGKISNHADVEEINAILNSKCFVVNNGSFAGWLITNGKIFQHSNTPFHNDASIIPVFVSINGKVVNQQGFGQPNICVGMEIIDPEHKFDPHYGFPEDHTAITDSNGNYYMLVEKGANGMLRFGVPVFDSLENKYSGEAFLLNNIQEQTIKTVTVYNNAKLSIINIMQNSSNDINLEYGHVKFITHDPSGNELVFYSNKGYASSSFEIYTLANVKGKLIFDSPTLYGEVNVDDTGDGTTPKEFQIELSEKTKTDCIIYGKVYLTNHAGETSVMAGQKLILFVLNETTGIEEQIIIEKTGDDGSYSFAGFKGTYITQVQCLNDSDEVMYQITYTNQVLIDESSFNHDIYFKEVTNTQ